MESSELKFKCKCAEDSTKVFYSKEFTVLVEENESVPEDKIIEDLED